MVGPCHWCLSIRKLAVLVGIFGAAALVLTLRIALLCYDSLQLDR